MNTCKFHPGRYAGYRDIDGEGYLCTSCHQKKMRQRARDKRNGLPAVGTCACGDTAVVVIKTLHGKMKLCKRCEQLEKLQAAMAY